MGGLHGGDGTGFRSRHFDQLLRTTLRAVAEIKMIPDQQQEWLFPRKLPRAMNRVPVTSWRRLLHELQSRRLAARGCRVRRLVPGENHDTDFLDPRAPHF